MVQTAGWLVRLTAYVLDGLAIGVPVAVIGVTLWGVSVDALAFILFTLFFYFLLLPVFWSGYTFGKRTLEIKIRQTNGENVKLDDMFLRVLVSGLIYVLTFGVGFIISVLMVMMRKDQRALHDFISGTDVVFAERN